jgi:hypothetical protein
MNDGLHRPLRRVGERLRNDLVVLGLIAHLNSGSFAMVQGDLAMERMFAWAVRGQKSGVMDPRGCVHGDIGVQGGDRYSSSRAYFGCFAAV